jgi:hypothetical protein
MRGHIGQRGKSFDVSIYLGVDPETRKQQAALSILETPSISGTLPGKDDRPP